MKRMNNLKFFICYIVTNAMYFFMYILSAYMTYISYRANENYLPSIILSIIFALITNQCISHIDKVVSLIFASDKLKIKPITYALFLDDNKFYLIVFVLFIPIGFNVENLIRYIVNCSVKSIKKGDNLNE